VPGRVFKRSINMRPRAGVVHQYHQANRGPPKYVEGV
jgi:hypothetical protein